MQANEIPAHEYLDSAGRPLPPQLATSIDAPELEGDSGRQDRAESEKQKVSQIRIAELEAELSHLRRKTNVVELP